MHLRLNIGTQRADCAAHFRRRVRLVKTVFFLAPGRRRARCSSLVGWVEPLRNPSAASPPERPMMGFARALPILRAIACAYGTFSRAKCFPADGRFDQAARRH